MLFHVTVGTSQSGAVNGAVVGLHVRCVHGAKSDAYTLFFQVAIKIARRSNARLYLTRHYATITCATASIQAGSDSLDSTVSAPSGKS